MDDLNTPIQKEVTTIETVVPADLKAAYATLQDQKAKTIAGFDEQIAIVTDKYNALKATHDLPPIED